MTGLLITREGRKVFHGETQDAILEEAMRTVKLLNAALRQPDDFSIILISSDAYEYDGKDGWIRL